MKNWKKKKKMNEEKKIIKISSASSFPNPPEVQKRRRFFRYLRNFPWKIYITSELTQFRVKIKILRIMSSCFYILFPKAEFLRDLIEWVPMVLMRSFT